MLHSGSRLLVVTTRRWNTVEPLLRSFAAAGFAVGLVHCQKNGPPIQNTAMRATSPAQLGRAVERAIRDDPPDLVVPTDAPALAVLRDLAARPGPGRSPLARILATSLGNAAAHDHVITPPALQRFARELGLPVPNAIEIGDEPALRALLPSVPLPVMLKGIGGWTGMRAETVGDVADGVAAYRRVSGADPLARRALERNARRGLAELIQARPRPVSLQQYVDGVTAKRIVICRDGTVLAGISIEPPAGSGATVAAKFIRHRTMATIADLVVGTLRLSGFVGFDFVLERETRQASLVTVKPYATPWAALAAPGEPSLAAALHGAFATIAPARSRARR